MFKSAFISAIVALGVLQLSVAGQENAPSKELIQYVRDAKKAGLEETQIQQNAIKAGWTEQDIKNALDLQHADPAKAAAGVPVTPNTSPGAAQVNSTTPIGATQTPLIPAKTTLPETTALPSAAAAGTPKPDVINRGVPDEYRIGEGDVIQINVWGEPTASVTGVVVRPDGMITMPLVKDISVAGLTPAEAEKTITEQLSKQIKAADVTVIVNQINSKKIFVVGGGVKKEGPISFTYRMTVMQALSEAGGLTDYAKRKKIYVLRNENGRQYKLNFDYDAVLKGEHMETNYRMIAGDILVVPNH
jgi:polysaccharide export outer membrane protein